MREKFHFSVAEVIMHAVAEVYPQRHSNCGSLSSTVSYETYMYVDGQVESGCVAQMNVDKNLQAIMSTRNLKISDMFKTYCAVYNYLGIDGVLQNIQGSTPWLPSGKIICNWLVLFALLFLNFKNELPTANQKSSHQC